MTLEKDAHPVDCHVGARVRLRRTLIGMSQEQLAAKLGLTFQQVQKYEKGTNRISASRLWEISRILDVPVSFFFDGAASTSGVDTGIPEQDVQSQLTIVAESSDSLQLLRHFVHIGNPRVRRAVVDLARALGTESVDDIPTSIKEGYGRSVP